MLSFCLFALIFQPQDSKQIFSGPQPGEKLPALKVRRVGDGSKTMFDLVSESQGGPVAFVFFHKTTRPAFGLTREIHEYADKRAKEMKGKKLRVATIILTDDAPSEEKVWRARQKYFPKSAMLTLSPDGKAGPGAWGLNRNVQLTIVIGKEGKVTSSFALGQPSLTVDGPKIGKALAAVAGGDPPDFAKLSMARTAMQKGGRRMAGDAKLNAMVQPLLREKLSTEELKKAVDAIEQYVGDNGNRRRQLQQSALRLTRGKRRMDTIPTKEAREQIQKWAKATAPAQDPNIRPLLQPLISKNATAEQVKAAAQKVEAYAEKNETARGQIGDICRRIIRADKLSNYGTKSCQDYMEKWAKEFKAEKKKPAKAGGR